MDSFKKYVEEIGQLDFSGWDFSYIQERVKSESPSWNYLDEVNNYLPVAKSLLDMGTGGGEFLSSLCPLPKVAYATEGYVPNISIAKKKLEPLGVKVIPVQAEKKLPFDNEQFDLIINRHESFSLDEVFRILKPGGTFITQQVGCEDLQDLNVALGDTRGSIYSKWKLDFVLKNIRDRFKVVKAKEEFPIVSFVDIGAVMFYLRAIPWQVRDFSIEKYSEQLLNLHREIEKNIGIKFREHRFMIVLQKN